MTEKWKAVLRAAAPVLALLVLALGVRLLPSAMGNSDTGTDQTPLLRPGRHTKGSMRPKKPAAIPVAPPKVTPATQQALQKVVTGQLAAFARNDFATALHFAAPQMRQSWSPESFRQMVQSGFAPLLSYRRASFAPARMAGDTVIMPVVITDANGSNTGFLYMFHQARPNDFPLPDTAAKNTRRGEWYIDGVSPLPMSDGDGPAGLPYPGYGDGGSPNVPATDAQEA